MRSVKQILRSVEQKKKEISDFDVEYYDCRDLKQSMPGNRDGGYPIRGFNASFNPYEVTEHLTDVEFMKWFYHNQRLLFREIKEEGVPAEKIKCMECNQIVQTPKDVIRWAGMIYHGKCFIGMVETEKHPITEFSKPYYERFKRTVFGL